MKHQKIVLFRQENKDTGTGRKMDLVGHSISRWER